VFPQEKTGCTEWRSAARQTFVAARRETDRSASGVLRAIAGAAAAGCLLALGASHTQAHSKSTQVTWTIDVAPIVEARCMRCHRTGGFAPMPLASYADAKKWAPAVRDEVLSGRMPPWPAAPGFGDFANDASLSAVEVELLARWADGGAPLGPAAASAHAAPAPRFDEARGARFELPAVEVSAAATRTATLPTSFASDRWIAGWTFEPGDRSLVEEASLSIDGAAVGAWTPFDDAIASPRGAADRLRAGATLAVAVRYRRTASVKTDRSTLTLYFDRAPSRELRHLAIGCGAHRLDADVDVLAVRPRSAAAGASIETIAYGADDAVTPLAVVSRYRPEFAVTYRLRSPVRLARGSRIEVRSPSSDDCGAVVDYVRRGRR